MESLLNEAHRGKGNEYTFAKFVAHEWKET